MDHRALDYEKAQSRFNNLINSEHWLAMYVSDLLSAHDLSGGIDFKTAEQILSAEKEEFEKDVAAARRILRIYGRQVLEETPQQSAAQASI
jgi:hypothetical protein